MKIPSTDHSTNNICTEIDDWLEDILLHNACWIVELSNGLTVIQDDGRPGQKIRSAWERLGIYCRANCVDILNMRLKFRSHVEHIGDNAQGFFFCYSVYGGFSKSYNAYLTGTLNEGILRVSKWQVPELVRVEFIDEQMEQIRNPEEAGICLIRNCNV